MVANKVLGWSSFGSFILAAVIVLFILVMILFPAAQPLFKSVNAQLLMIVADGLALLAAFLGLASRQTVQGKIGGITGLVLFIVITIFLSFTLITSTTTTIGPV